MSATDHGKEKLMLIDWILKQEKLSNIKALSDLASRLDQELADAQKTAGYRPKGIKITMEQLRQSILLSLEELNKTEIITLDRLEQDSDQW